MNLELETWDIINSYFRDIPNYLVRHHIDSFNDFINNKIPQIMKNFANIPPYVLIDKDTKSPIENVNVYISNSSIGTRTDANGMFSVRTPAAGKFELVLSSLGYEIGRAHV